MCWRSTSACLELIIVWHICFLSLLPPNVKRIGKCDFANTQRGTCSLSSEDNRRMRHIARTSCVATQCKERRIFGYPPPFRNEELDNQINGELSDPLQASPAVGPVVFLFIPAGACERSSEIRGRDSGHGSEQANRPGGWGMWRPVARSAKGRNGHARPRCTITVGWD